MKIVQLNEIKGMTFPAGRTTRVLTGPDLLPAKNFTAGYVVIQPKGKVPLHAHSNEEIYILVRGTGKIKVESREEIIEAVSAVYIEPDTEHLLQNMGEDEMIMIFVYSPAGIANHWSEEMAGKLT